MARNSTKGLHIGVRVHVRGKGKRADGSVTGISQDPQTGTTYIEYRADFNGGVYIAKLPDVRIMRRKTP